MTVINMTGQLGAGSVFVIDMELHFMEKVYDIT